jgi:hypothetical protein
MSRILILILLLAASPAGAVWPARLKRRWGRLALIGVVVAEATPRRHLLCGAGAAEMVTVTGVLAEPHALNATATWCRSARRRFFQGDWPVRVAGRARGLARQDGEVIARPESNDAGDARAGGSAG